MTEYNEPIPNPLFEDAVALANDPERLNSSDALQLAAALDVISDRIAEKVEQPIYRETLKMLEAKLKKAGFKLAVHASLSSTIESFDGHSRQ